MSAGAKEMARTQPRLLWGPPLSDYQHRFPRSLIPLIVSSCEFGFRHLNLLSRPQKGGNFGSSREILGLVYQ